MKKDFTTSIYTEANVPPNLMGLDEYNRQHADDGEAVFSGFMTREMLSNILLSFDRGTPIEQMKYMMVIAASLSRTDLEGRVEALKNVKTVITGMYYAAEEKGIDLDTLSITPRFNDPDDEMSGIAGIMVVEKRQPQRRSS